MGSLRVIPVIDHSVRLLCLKTYYNHPRGCPNFNKKKGCPPGAPLFEDVFDLSKPVYAIFNKFDLRSHIYRMADRNPHWTEHQLRCVLYWQGKARKQLKEKIDLFMFEHQEVDVVETCPEAMGVNVTATMAVVGIILEWPPVRVAYQVALAGTRKE